MGDGMQHRGRRRAGGVRSGGDRERGQHAWSIVRLLLVVALLAGLAVGCGDDDDDDAAPDTGASTTAAAEDTAATETTVASDDTTADTEATADTGGGGVSEPDGVVGGEVTLLMFNEIQGLDPVRMTVSAGSDGQRAFALYGALLTFSSETGALDPLLAESFEPDDTFTTWTLTLRPDLVFSDGSVFDAAAVQANWARAQVADNRSPAFGLASGIASMEVTDPLTLVATLATPNSQFGVAMARSSLNYIASAEAIAAGHDLVNDPIGAGPYVLEEWLRDDHMTLARNPDWFDAPRPYIDRITLRTVIDNQQRADTFASGDADGMYSNDPQSWQPLVDDGATRVSAQVSSGQALVFNASTAPFDDVRLRQVVSLAVDRHAAVDIMFGDEAHTADAFTAPDSPWYDPAADLPELDTEAAQALLDEIVAESGPVSATLLTQARQQVIAEFIQSSLNQLDGIEVQIESTDDPTLITNVTQGNYQFAMWGFPWLNPDPGLYNPLRSGLPTNYSRYENADVDAALDGARATDDQDERAGLYAEVFAQVVVDMPYLPLRDPDNGYVLDPSVVGGHVYEDGILRVDLISLAE